jgi:phage terminase small subunit
VARKYPERLMPPDALRAVWRHAARTDPGVAALRTRKLQAAAASAYDQRWFRVWRATLDIVLEQIDETEVDPHLWLIADFVEARRLAAEYQATADREGRYSTNEAGRTFAHPGIDKAREARKESREIAAVLGITPEAMRDAGIEGPAEDDGPESDQAGL